MAKRKRSALVELRRLETAFQKDRAAVLARAKDEAVGVVSSIVKQLQTFATDFPDIVASAVRHLIGALIMNKDASANHTLAKHAKLSPGVVSVVLRQLRDEGKVKSDGKGRATT